MSVGHGDTDTLEIRFLATLLAAFLLRTGNLLNRDQVDAIHQQVLGTQVNGTALRRAKELLEQPVRDREADGLRWAHAYLSLYPDTSLPVIAHQYALRFHQAISSAVLYDLRRTLLPKPDAIAQLAEIEARLRVDQKQFFEF